jgi:hydroxymethylglutaryl-CoA synthase
MSSYGITEFAAYVPMQALQRASIFEAVGWAQGGLKAYARGSRRYAEWDEDAITLAVAACRNLASDSTGFAAQGQFCFASTTAPFLDRQNATVVATALNLPPSVHSYDIAGGQRAALAPLMIACRQGSGDLLLAAADKRPCKPASVMEMLSGDGAVALRLGSDDCLVELVDCEAVHADMVDHYRTAATGADYVFEDRWVRDEGVSKLVPQAVLPLLARQGLKGADLSHFILATPNTSHARALVKALGLNKDALADPLFDNIGHTGAAHPLMMLVNLLETKAEAGQWIMLTGFGQGVDAVLLRVGKKLSAYKARRSLVQQVADIQPGTNYLKYLSAAGGIDLDWGMRAERDNRTAQTVAYNKSQDLYGFVGGECSACGTAQYPKSRRCVNPNCGALDTQEPYHFSNKAGKVKSFTEDWLAFTRSPPHLYGNISFEGGGNIFMEMAGFAPGELKIGSDVEMQFRIKDIDTQRGFHRYFWKAIPKRRD